jgi:hypothetical protein
MDTDGLGYQGLAEEPWLTRSVNEVQGPKSVCICVHPWFMTSSSDFNCGFQVQRFCWRLIFWNNEARV